MALLAHTNRPPVFLQSPPAPLRTLFRTEPTRPVYRILLIPFIPLTPLNPTSRLHRIPASYLRTTSRFDVFVRTNFKSCICRVAASSTSFPAYTVSPKLCALKSLFIMAPAQKLSSACTFNADNKQQGIFARTYRIKLLWCVKWRKSYSGLALPMAAAFVLPLQKLGFITVE